MELLLVLLTVLFVALKLLDRIDWSWPTVLAPIWVPFALLVFVGLVGGILAA